MADDQISYRVFLIVASVMICAVSAAGEIKQGLFSFGVERTCAASREIQRRTVRQCGGR